MKKLWIISGVIAVTLVIALGQFETKVPEGWVLFIVLQLTKTAGDWNDRWTSTIQLGNSS